MDEGQCAVCGRPWPTDPAAARRLRPFCSPRCADVDLGRWFTGAYAVPVPAGEEENDENE